jgi:hypothetical protein
MQAYVVEDLVGGDDEEGTTRRSTGKEKEKEQSPSSSSRVPPLSNLQRGHGAAQSIRSTCMQMFLKFSFILWRYAQASTGLHSTQVRRQCIL